MQKYQNDIADCRREIILIEEHINKNKFDSFNQFLISYSIIKATGVIEIICKNMLVEKLSEGASSEAKNFFEAKIRDSSYNPSVDMILRLLQDISRAWQNEFDAKTKGQNEKVSLKSLIGLRNDFAHGRSVTATIGRIKEYYRDSITVLTWLHDILNP